MQERPRGNEYRTTIVCIDTYESGVPTGRFYNPACPEGKSFRSLSQFLTQMEDMLDAMQLPQSFTALRSFTAPATDPSVSASQMSHEGKLGTFAVRVLFRQNASWQGSITWLEGKREERFRSVLELVLLMDSALRGE